MKNSTFIRTCVAITRISKWFKLRMVWRESLPNYFGWLLQNNDHECTHQVGSISLLIELRGCVVKEPYSFVAVIGEQSAEFPYVLMSISDI